MKGPSRWTGTGNAYDHPLHATYLVATGRFERLRVGTAPHSGRKPGCSRPLTLSVSGAMVALEPVSLGVVIVVMGDLRRSF